jgi:ATP-dependent 26S proteasome regulatory subunit
MSPFLTELLRVLRECGLAPGGEPPNPARLAAIPEVCKLITDNPEAVAAEIVKLQREAAHAKQQCTHAAQAATELQKLLEQLVEGGSMLCHAVSVRTEGPDQPTAIVRIGNQLHDLPVHPSVPREDLERLPPWGCVRVNRKEMVVVGTCNDDSMFAQSLGPMVEFQSYFDRDRGLVQVAREGREADIVALAPGLREQPMTRGARLVLQRDNEGIAICAAPAIQAESKYEVPIEQIETRFDDLAEIGDVMERLMIDTLMRLVFPDIRKSFDLRPLRGMLLYSYKPGMGKTAAIRALARFLQDHSDQLGFEVCLYVVKPNSLKSVWHGGDAKLVREELCGAIRARQMLPRNKPLVQLVVLDEIDSLGRRAGGDDMQGVYSSAQNDGVQSLLAEMDGMIQPADGRDEPASHVLWVGLTNRPDAVDDALKRPGRFGDLVLEMPDITQAGAESIMAIYARNPTIPWDLDGAIHDGLDEARVRARFLRPALAIAFPAPVLRYTTDSGHTVEVTAGEILAGVHYMEAMNYAKRRAANRRLFSSGVPAIGFQDVVDGLMEQAHTTAKQMAADRHMLMGQLRIKAPVTRVEIVPPEENHAHRYLRLATA